MSGSTMRRVQSSGFSMGELLVVAACLAVALAIALPFVSAARDTSTLYTAATETCNAMRSKAAAATRGERAVFCAETDVVAPEGVLVNPKFVEPPAGAVVAHEITFEAGTATARLDGGRGVGAILLADGARPEEAYAIVAGSAGRISLLQRSGASWKEAQ